MNWCMCVKPEFMYSHVCYKLRNSLGGYGGIRVVRVSDDLDGSSSRGRGGVVAKPAAVHSRWCVKKSVRVQMGSDGHSASFPSPSVGQSDAFADFHCINSYPLDQVGSGKFVFWGEDLWLAEKGYFVNVNSFLAFSSGSPAQSLLLKDTFYSLSRQQPSC